MKKLILFTLLFVTIQGFAQQKKEFESFKKESELKAALQNFKLDNFIDKEVLFIKDTLEVTLQKAEFNSFFKKNLKLPKGYTIQKGSETNRGYTQIYGIYKGDDVVYWITLNLDQRTSKLMEVEIREN